MAVRVHHLRGSDAWLRCDHASTRLDGPTDTIRLARVPLPEADDPGDRAPWVDAWVGGFAPPVHPGTCDGDERPWRLGDRGAGTVAADAGTWTPTGELPADLRALVDDGCGRAWGLIDGTRARALGDDGVALEVPLPGEARWLAVAEHGLYAATDGALWLGRWGRRWVEVPVEPGLVLGGVAARGRQVVALALRDGDPVLLEIRGDRITREATLALPAPTAIALDGDGRIWLPVVTGPPPRRTRLAVITWGEPGASHHATFEIGRFDGRGLVFVDGATWGSTPTGWVKAYRVSVPVEPEGRVETFALDSGRHGCTWHRVFLDVCLPEGTGIEIAARTSDALPDAFPDGDPRPRLPLGADEGLPPPAPLGSLAPDDIDGWVPVGATHLQALFADAPAPPRGELPVPDPVPRGAETPTAATHTLEGLLKNEPGRYLWLRIRLRGRGASSPVLAGVRVHAPRPSLLAFLPAWWRADPDARQMEELLALFEAPLTRLEERVDALPALFDPGATPPEALDWLAGFLGLVFEPQLPERSRRALLSEAAALYRRRGTVGALERLCTILAAAPVRVVEGWRERTSGGGVLGEQAVMGNTLELGGDLEPEERGTDAAIRAWFATRAHRFRIVVHRPCTPWLRALLERAIERNKPAHTQHELCFADALTVGATAVGVTTLPAPAPPPETAVVDEALLGGATLSTAPAALPRPPIPPSPEEP